MSDLGPRERTRVRRLAEKARYDAATINDVFDHAAFCYVSAVVDGLALSLPTLHAREDTTIFLHGNQSNAILRAALNAPRTALSATIMDGLRLARSGFESSVAYRSVVAIGTAREVVALDDKRRILDLLIEHTIPGRTSELRPVSDRELRLTLVVALDIDEASVKVSSGPTDDGDDDLALPIWAGDVPVRLVYGAPEPDTRGAMATQTIPLAESVRRLLARRD